MGNSVSMVYRNRHRNAKRDQTTIGKIIQNPRAARLFSLAMALTMVLVAVSVCIQYRNVQDQRKTQQEWHGAWQAVLMDPDLTALQEASENLVIKKRGSVQTAAMKDGTIAGTGDKQFFEMANLSIKKGRLPETGSEMAAEALWLDERGFSYRIGQKIQIDEKVFTLTGILDSYTANWTAGNHVPQIWITRLDKPEHTLLYMQAKSDTKPYLMNGLRNREFWSGICIWNMDISHFRLQVFHGQLRRQQLQQADSVLCS